jgi:hypothetical protein
MTNFFLQINVTQFDPDDLIYKLLDRVYKVELREVLCPHEGNRYKTHQGIKKENTEIDRVFFK